MGARRLTVAALAWAALAGCGATPPQAPGPDAYRLNNALSTLSTACGQASEIQAFEDGARDMTITEHEAQAQIAPLVRIYRRNPDWIFQGKTVRELVQMSSSYLDECGLHAAARRLRTAVASR